MHHTLLAMLLLAVPHAAGLATPVLETVAVRGAASRSLRVAEGQADTIDSGTLYFIAHVHVVHVTWARESRELPGRL
tara:strand:+ start:254 stop:484 length:231 start_codon:yes stop_codon:yes gene_type:complete